MQALTYKPFGAFRLLLAACVVLQHIHPVLPHAIVAREEYLELGSLAVDVFFVASGYIITEAIARVYQGRPWAFLANRAVRLLPAVALVVTLTAILWAVFIAQGDHLVVRAARLVAVSLAHLFPLTKSLTSEYEILGVMWALRVEFTFYLLCFLALFAMPYLTTPRRQAAVIVLGAIVLTALFAYDCLRDVQTMLRFIPYFVFGVGLYLASHMQSRTLARLVGAIAALAFVGMLVEQTNRSAFHEAAGFARDRLAQTLILVLVVALFTVLSFMRVGGRLARVDRTLGDLSFPLYVAHDPVIVFAALSWTPGVPTAIATAMAALAAAWLLYVVLERPLMALRTRIRKSDIRFADAGPQSRPASAPAHTELLSHARAYPSLTPPAS
ncbi:MAG: acyltransferase [Pseudomonadota bacterium]